MWLGRYTTLLLDPLLSNKETPGPLRIALNQNILFIFFIYLLSALSNNKLSIEAF